MPDFTFAKITETTEVLLALAEGMRTEVGETAEGLTAAEIANVWLVNQLRRVLSTVLVRDAGRPELIALNATIATEKVNVAVARDNLAAAQDAAKDAVAVAFPEA